MALVAIAGKKPSELPVITTNINDIYLAELADGTVGQTPLADQSSDIERRLIPNTIFADRENPLDSEVLTYIQGLTPVPNEGSLFYTNTGIAQTTTNQGQNPNVVWEFIDNNVIRTKDVTRNVEIPASAFVDVNNPTGQEAANFINPTNTPGLGGAVIVLEYEHTDGRVWKWLKLVNYNDDGTDSKPNVTVLEQPETPQEVWKKETFTLADGQQTITVANGSLPINPNQIWVSVQGNELDEGATEDYTYVPSTGAITLTTLTPSAGMKMKVRWVEYPA